SRRVQGWAGAGGDALGAGVGEALGAAVGAGVTVAGAAVAVAPGVVAVTGAGPTVRAVRATPVSRRIPVGMAPAAAVGDAVGAAEAPGDGVGDADEPEGPRLQGLEGALPPGAPVTTSATAVAATTAGRWSRAMEARHDWYTRPAWLTTLSPSTKRS